MNTQAYTWLLLAIQMMVSHPAALSQTIQPEIFAPGIISGPGDEAAPAFTPDGKTVYFHRRGPGLLAVILVSHLQHGKWTKPQIAPFSGEWSDIEPAMAPDGSYLVFASNRPAMPGGKPLDGFWSGRPAPQRGGNLWRVDWKNGQFGEPYRLPDIINSGSTIFAPSVAADGSLYFMRPLADTGKFHIYRAASHNGQFEKPEPVSFSAASHLGDVDPVVAPDESFLIFSSSRPSAARLQLFIVYKQDGKWGEPIMLGDEINRPPQSNMEARLSPDLRTLYFSCNWVPPITYPSDKEKTRQKLEQLQWNSLENNIWYVPIDQYTHNRKQ